MDGVQAAVTFEGAIRRAIHELKYRGRTELASPLAELMVTAWGSGLFPVDCVMPVPLHPRRIQERGYNQATLIAELFAQQTHLPILADALVRTRMTESQTSLGAFARRKNVDGAFTARSSMVRGRSILLVDDVCTTGSTLQACADALREGGASQVYALTVARAGWDIRSGAVDDSNRQGTV
jgi:ComF family protein